tara:strand:- start:177 stop:407 length:231 start_codon:yes stop_codon:yes gene_type:complete
MANSKDYTITTIQTNLNQINKKVLTQATNTRIRLAFAPYTVSITKNGSLEDGEDSPKFPFGAFAPDGDGIKKINRD